MFGLIPSRTFVAAALIGEQRGEVLVIRTADHHLSLEVPAQLTGKCADVGVLPDKDDEHLQFAGFRGELLHTLQGDLGGLVVLAERVKPATPLVEDQHQRRGLVLAARPLDQILQSLPAPVLVVGELDRAVQRRL